MDGMKRKYCPQCDEVTLWNPDDDRCDCGAALLTGGAILNHLFWLDEHFEKMRKKKDAEIARLKATIEPVRSWYDGDGELTDVAEMLTSAIADLQEDRAAVLKLTTRVAELEKLRGEDFEMRQRLG